jgi:hypothetical protein
MPKLLMISAMYENGGNLTQRHFDGHPDLHVYPFEAQLGTAWSPETPGIPQKFRWPVLPQDPSGLSQLFADTELRCRVENPKQSKFKDVPFDFSKSRRAEWLASLPHPLTPQRLVKAHFEATFEAWQNHWNRGNAPQAWVGFSPMLALDASAFFRDMGTDGFMLHVRRDPEAAYRDTLRRAQPPAREDYLARWTFVQEEAERAKEAFPDQFFILNFEDICAHARGALAPVCRALGISADASLEAPSFNGERLKAGPPWGVVDAGLENRQPHE